MKATSILALAFALATTAAAAQTVAPGTAPGAQTGNPSNMPSAGSPADQTMTNDRMNNGRMDKMSGTDRKNKKMMHKDGKMKSSDGSMKTKTKM